MMPDICRYVLPFFNTLTEFLIRHKESQDEIFYNDTNKEGLTRNFVVFLDNVSLIQISFCVRVFILCNVVSIACKLRVNPFHIDNTICNYLADRQLKGIEPMSPPKTYFHTGDSPK